MTLRMILICVGGLGIISCNSNEKSEPINEASGIYVREYAIEVIHPETGNRLGMRQIRDSIFVEQSETGFLVSNHKWRLNDYDQEGWINMKHADDRPMASFHATYDEKLKTLSSRDEGVPHGFLIDPKRGRLTKSKSSGSTYLRVGNSY